MVQISISLPNFNSEFDANIHKDIRATLSKSINQVINNIKLRIQQKTKTALVGSPEYQSIFGGKLQAELGIPSPGSIDVIIDRWVAGITIKYLPTSKGRFGTLSIGMIEADYSDVLTLNEASYSYTSGRTGGVIDWLRWLLLEGNNVIVRNYDFAPTITRGSRTRLGIMVNRQGGVWRVPPEFAGTQSDNFVLRALQEIDKEIDIIVRQEITKGFK